MCREYHALNVSGFGVTPFGVEGSFSTKIAMKKTSGGRPVELVADGAGIHPL